MAVTGNDNTYPVATVAELALVMAGVWSIVSTKHRVAVPDVLAANTVTR